LSEPIIEVTGLTVRYPLRRRPALQNLSFTVAQHETLLILGSSGCGKSTLALTLNGLIPHDIEAEISGSIKVAGVNAATASVETLTRQIGVVFQDAEAQFCTLNVADEVAFGLENLGIPRSEMDERIHRALAQVGLAGMEQRALRRLSGGEKQRLALAALLAMKPKIIILDEPTANLDPAATTAFFRLIAPLRQEQTILIIEHKLDACIHLVDRALVLTPEGTLLAEGAPREIFRQEEARLQEYGIWIPQVTEWALALRRAGHDIQPLPLTVQEAAETVRRLDIPVPLRSQPPRRPAFAATVPAVKIDGLNFTYPKADRPALHDVHLTVPKSSLFALLGPNGSGKSTLGAHLIGIHQPAPGKVFIFGQDASAAAGMTLARLTEMVGYVFQNPEHQFVADTVYDELAYSLEVRKEPEERVRKRVQELLADFQLEPLARANPFTLSQGQKRRLSVATMLTVGQKLLVLDEPTFGQDRRTTERMIARWRRLQNQGVTILFITHDMRLVLEVADAVAVLAAGQVIFQGTPGQLYEQEDLLQQANLVPPPLFRLAKIAGRSALTAIASRA